MNNITLYVDTNPLVRSNCLTDTNGLPIPKLSWVYADNFPLTITLRDTGSFGNTNGTVASIAIGTPGYSSLTFDPCGIVDSNAYSASIRLNTYELSASLGFAKQKDYQFELQVVSGSNITSFQHPITIIHDVIANQLIHVSGSDFVISASYSAFALSASYAFTASVALNAAPTVSSSWASQSLSSSAVLFTPTASNIAYYIPFTTGSGYQQLLIDTSSILYNPSRDLLIVQNISASLLGTASLAQLSTRAITASQADNAKQVLFGDFTDESPPVGPFAYLRGEGGALLSLGDGNYTNQMTSPAYSVYDETIAVEPDQEIIRIGPISSWVSGSSNFGIGLRYPEEDPYDKLQVAGNISCSAITASRLSGTASYADTASYVQNNDIVLDATSLRAGSGDETVTIDANLVDVGGVIQLSNQGLEAGFASPDITTIINGQIVAPRITGSLFGTASWARNTISSSYTLTASVALNAAPTVSASWASRSLSASRADSSALVDYFTHDTNGNTTLGTGIQTGASTTNTLILGPNNTASVSDNSIIIGKGNVQVNTGATYNGTILIGNTNLHSGGLGTVNLSASIIIGDAQVPNVGSGTHDVPSNIFIGHGIHLDANSGVDNSVLIGNGVSISGSDHTMFLGGKAGTPEALKVTIGGITTAINTLDVWGNISASIITASLFFGTASLARTASYISQSIGFPTSVNGYFPYYQNNTLSTSSLLHTDGTNLFADALIIGSASFAITASNARTASNAIVATTANAISFIPSVAVSASWVSASNRITTADTASYLTGSILFNGSVNNYIPKWSASVLTYTSSLLENGNSLTCSVPISGTINNAISASYSTTASFALNSTTYTLTYSDILKVQVFS